MKEYVYDCFEETLSFAETLGWTEPFDLVDQSDETWTPEASNSMEESAIEFIESKGYQVVFGE
jgi:hypothetical protein